MESRRPAIIVSFGVTAHWRLKKASVQQESIPWQSFVKDTPLHEAEHPCSVPSKRGPGRDDFRFSDYFAKPKCAQILNSPVSAEAHAIAARPEIAYAPQRP